MTNWITNTWRTRVRSQITSRIRQALLRSAVFPTSMTSGQALSRLVTQLQPIDSGLDLVRLGPAGDGGYLVPDDLEGIEACFSPGVSSISGFESDCANRGMPVFLADKSVDSPGEQHQKFTFLKKFVGATSDADFTTLDDWVDQSQLSSNGDLLLQIDIEGFEYEVFISATDSLLRRFRIIVAEFHWLDQLWNGPFFDLASRAFEKILKAHACIHIHPNNCCGSLKVGSMEMPRVMEFTFLRRDRLKRSTRELTFPHALDFDNTARPTLPLPSCWYRNQR